MEPKKREKHMHFCISKEVGPMNACILFLRSLNFLFCILATKSLVISPEETWSLKMENQLFRYLKIVSITNNFQTVIRIRRFGTVCRGCMLNGT